MWCAFSLNCSSPILKKIELIGDGKYFLVCIKNENYLYSEDTNVISQLRGFLFLNNVTLQFISQARFLDVLNDPETAEYQKLYGSSQLYKRMIA